MQHVSNVVIKGKLIGWWLDTQTLFICQDACTVRRICKCIVDIYLCVFVRSSVYTEGVMMMRQVMMPRRVVSLS